MTELSFAWYDIPGLVGVAMMLATYLLLQAEKIRSDSMAYSFFNALGAALVLWSLVYAFNLSAFVIESCWLLISLYGIAKAMRRDKAAAP